MPRLAVGRQRCVVELSCSFAFGQVASGSRQQCRSQMVLPFGVRSSRVPPGPDEDIAPVVASTGTSTRVSERGPFGVSRVLFCPGPDESVAAVLVSVPESWAFVVH